MSGIMFSNLFEITVANSLQSKFRIEIDLYERHSNLSLPIFGITQIIACLQDTGIKLKHFNNSGDNFS